jgi:hypothetical protein
MSFVDQLPALIGVVLGAGTSYIVTALTNRANWRRLQETRWDERRLAVYADYGNAIKEKALIISRMAATKGLNRNPEPLATDETGLAMLAEAEVRRAMLIETVRLLSDPPTMEAVHHLNRCVWHLEWIVRDGLRADSTAWDQAYSAYMDARDTFIQCGRDSLRVPGSAASSNRQLPPWFHNQQQLPETSTEPT